MKYYRAIGQAFILGVLVDANAILGLTEEQERELKVGKFVEEKPDLKALRRDPNSKAKVKIGNKLLVACKQSEIEGIEGKALEEGFVLYPPAKSNIMVGEQRGGGTNATTFQVTR